MLSRSKTQVGAKNQLFKNQNKKSEHEPKKDPDQVAENQVQSQHRSKNPSQFKN